MRIATVRATPSNRRCRCSSLDGDAEAGTEDLQTLGTGLLGGFRKR
jgi:hypothetical protein